ncbi:hypothetical protein VNI00_011432 [Paramarasmius palmivorus]|uniref:Golgi apparatus membrane protein TVP38 n=1 Tax=Paramarasmius palmivorus TaxID=297713 RepID=A0AAW0CF85_9AGAR
MDPNYRYPNNQSLDAPFSSYPPPNQANFPSSSKPSTPAGPWATNVNLNLNQNGNRNPARTPSPTPSELKELKSGAIDWKGMMKWRFWIRKEWIWYYVALVIILVVTALVTIYHEQIVHALTPVTRWLHDHSWGWVVPILVLFVISFPPLFGHEIVAILCGLVWGLWIGFGIVAAGTFLGEVGNFYAFKYCCAARGEKLEKTRISYACLAKVVRDGGFKIALIARLSAIPGHFTTAVFSTCGMGIITFSLAAILSMPKQFITVYLGVLLEQAGSGTKNKTSDLITKIVLIITFIITIAAMWYILRQMNKVKPDVIYARRKARQVKMNRTTLYGNDSTEFNPNPNASETDIPLTAPGLSTNIENKATYPFSSEHQRGNSIHAPRPQRAVNATNMYGYSKSDDDLESAKSSSEHQHNYGYAYTPTRQSTDDVTWDTGAYSNAERRPSYPPGITPNPHPQRGFTTSPDHMDSTPQRNPSQRVPQPPQFSQPLSHSSALPRVAQTPTQTQYAYAISSPHSNPGSPSLPTPKFPSQPPASSPSPVLAPLSQPQHMAEPTDMTFHTAMGSISEYDGRNGSETSFAPPFGNGRRQQGSPPPPSYTTNLR